MNTTRILLILEVAAWAVAFLVAGDPVFGIMACIHVIILALSELGNMVKSE